MCGECAGFGGYVPAAWPEQKVCIRWNGKILELMSTMMFQFSFWRFCYLLLTWLQGTLFLLNWKN